MLGGVGASLRAGVEVQGQLQVVQMLALVAAGLLVTVGHNVTSMVPRLFLFYV